MDEFGSEVGSDYMAALTLLESDPSLTLDYVDLQLVDLVLTHLTPSETSWTNKRSMHKWAERVAQASGSLSTLLQLQQESTTTDATVEATKAPRTLSAKALSQKLQCLSFLRLFVRDAALPLSLPPPSSLQFSAHMLQHCDFSLRTSFTALVTALQQYVKKANDSKSTILNKFALLIEVYIAQVTSF